MPKCEIDLGFCPRCKEEFFEEKMMHVAFGVKWCWLCSFDMEENPIERRQWVSWAKEFAKNMGGSQ